MTIEQLKARMKRFIETHYNAYYFKMDTEVIGYALVNVTTTPLYLRQFLIDRKYRRNHYGKMAFDLLLEELKADSIDIEVLTWNESGQKFWESLGFVERSKYMRFNK